MPAVPIAAAAARWLDAIAPLPPRRLPPAEALGCVLAAEVAAPHDLPPFDRAMMDGFAVRLADAGRRMAVQGVVHAGDAPEALPADGVLAIMTGAPVPAGAEAVVPYEACQAGDGAVSLPAAIRPGANIVARGGECRAGAAVLHAGSAVGALAVAAAAALGLDALPVHPRPRVAVITTGAELRQDGAIDGGAIRDSNGPMLAALCAGLGVPCGRQSLPDDPAAIRAAIATAPAELLILTGGVGAGDRDFVPAALAEAGFATLVRGVDQKPGKPLLLAAGGGRLAAALPGNPLAVHWCFTRFVAPALRRLMGREPHPAMRPATLAAALPGAKERPWAVPVRTRVEGGRLLAWPLPPASSGDLAGPAHADGYVVVAAGAAALATGADVEVLPCDA